MITGTRGRGVRDAGARSGVVCGWAGVSACVGEVDAGDASAGQEAEVMGAGTGDVGYVGCDAPLVQGGRSIVLDE